MKRILMSFALIALLGGSAMLRTRAAWTDAVTVTNNQITTGTVDLEVSTDYGSTWNSTSAASTMVLSNLAPGAAATSAYSFTLRNVGSVGPLTLTGQVTASNISPTAGVDKSQLMVQVYDLATGDVSSEATLTAWESGAQTLTSTLAPSETKHYGLRSRLLTTADNTWQGQTVTFTLTVIGSQP